MSLKFLTEGDNGSWAGEYGLSHPVFEDPSMTAISGYIPTGSFGIPTYAVLDRELRLQAENVSESSALSIVDLLLNDPIPTVSWPMP